MKNFDFLDEQLPTPLQKLEDEFTAKAGVDLWLKRDDLIHPEISGNKWRKLKYNLLKAREQNCESILTFGGAFSNHILATAAAGKEFGIPTIGVIRGEELDENSNPTLRQAAELGMQLVFISRGEYRDKENPHYIHHLHKKYGNFHLMPEGGANYYGVQGCIEITREIDVSFDYIATACGTGTTLAGLAIGLKSGQHALGFPVLKGGDFLQSNVEKLLYQNFMDKEAASESMEKIEWITGYHFGGYAKKSEQLVEFMDWFAEKYGTELDFVYTGKMLFGLYDLMQKGFFEKGQQLVSIHTGGIQGNRGLMQADR